MKAAQVQAFGGVEHLVVTELEDPTPKEEQTLVTVKAVSINPFDSFVRRGAMPKITVPYIPGGDFSGVTDDGREVFGTAIALAGGSGAMATRAAVNNKTMAEKPTNTTFEEAAALPLVASSAVTALEQYLKLQPGQKILIHGGAGGIGHIAIQLAKHMGAWVATTVRRKDIDFVKSLGADEVVDYTRDDFTAKLKEFDAVYDLVGGDVDTKSFRVLKKGGMLVSMKGPPDPKSCELKGITGIGEVTKQSTELLLRVKELHESGKFKVHIDRVFPLDQIAEAWTYKDEGHPQGKVVVTL